MLGLGWILFTTNATNFMDGLNGLAAGSAAVACLAFALAAGGAAAWPAWLVVAGVVGFLPFNYPAARIFMGDVGSQFLGFVLAGLALRHAGTPRLSAILPLGLSPLLLDAAFTLLRRARAGARLTEAHRGHLYQVAQRAGMPAWAVSAAYWAMAGWAGGCGVAWGAGGDAVWLGAALMPFGVWGVWVARFARRAGLGAWG